MKKQDPFPPSIENLLYGLRHGLFEDPLGQALVRIVQAGVCDERIADMIQSRVSKDQLRQAFSLTPFRPARLSQGQLIIGLNAGGRPITIPFQYLNAHSLTVANTGAGKTTKSRFYSLQIAPQVPGMWLIDFRKKEFRILRPYLARLGVDLIVVPARQMRLNLLQVPYQTHPNEWCTRAADMFIQVLGLPPRASKLLQTVIFRLYRRFGIFEGGTAYPTIFELFEDIKQDQQANPQARLAILDSLEPVICSLGPRVLAWRRGWAAHDLAGHHLVFEFAGLGEMEKNLLLNYLVQAEFVSRISRGVSNPKMNLWICADEAQRLCTGSAGGPGPQGISDLLGLIRGAGVGADLSILSAADLSPHVLSNTATKVLGRCGSAADYTAAGHSMGLTAEQIQWVQLHLKPGWFIGQAGEGDWRLPFVFRIPSMNCVQTTNNDMDEADTGSLPALPTIPA